MEQFDILIVGAGAAGISAAKAATAAGCESVLLVDCGDRMGGILLQCAHRGFGEQENGTEYVQRLLQDFPEAVTVYLCTMVLEITENRTARLSCGREVAFSQLIWAAGCREIPAGALPIAGTRPRGVYTAGQMQALVNLHGHLPQSPVVILGSGDIGLVMARQLAEAGLAVTLVEQKPACGGLLRNRSCVTEREIPLHCNTTVAELFGAPELEAVELTNGIRLPCRTLLIAVGLVPEQELIAEYIGAEWLHLCGNGRTVHPMVDTVVHESARTGEAAWKKITDSL